MRWILSLLMVVLCGFSSVMSAEGDKVFLEQNNLLVMEVESAPVSSYWVKETSQTGFTGSGYYVWRHGSGLDYDVNPGLGVLTYRFKIVTGGTYTIRVRSYHCYSDNSAQNDLFLKLDDREWEKGYQSKTYACNWNLSYKIIRNDLEDVWPDYTNVTPGYHTIQISGRSYGYAIDRINMYNTVWIKPSAYPNPYDVTIPESPLEGASSIADQSRMPVAVAVAAYPNPARVGQAVAVQAAVGQTVSIYNRSGQVVFNGPTGSWQTKGMEPGIYYVKSGSQAHRLVLTN